MKYFLFSLVIILSFGNFSCMNYPLIKVDNPSYVGSEPISNIKQITLKTGQTIIFDQSSLGYIEKDYVRGLDLDLLNVKVALTDLQSLEYIYYSGLDILEISNINDSTIVEDIDQIILKDSTIVQFNSMKKGKIENGNIEGTTIRNEIVKYPISNIEHIYQFKKAETKNIWLYSFVLIIVSLAALIFLLLNRESI